MLFRSKHFGKDYLKKNGISEETLEDIFSEFDLKFVLPIDLIDNGAVDLSTVDSIANLTLPVLLENFKPAFDETSTTAHDDAFIKALPIAEEFIQSSIQSLSAKHRANKTINSLINKSGNTEILELPMGMPFQSALENINANTYFL